jgi:hypothetical protein
MFLPNLAAGEQRSHLLPAHVIVRFCQAMCLFFDDDYEEVMRKLAGSLKSMNSWRDDWKVPSMLPSLIPPGPTTATSRDISAR